MDIRFSPEAGENTNEMTLKKERLKIGSFHLPICSFSSRVLK
jgi:hypothetical protein